MIRKVCYCRCVFESVRLAKDLRKITAVEQTMKAAFQLPSYIHLPLLYAGQPVVGVAYVQSDRHSAFVRSSSRHLKAACNTFPKRRMQRLSDNNILLLWSTAASRTTNKRATRNLRQLRGWVAPSVRISIEAKHHIEAEDEI